MSAKKKFTRVSMSEQRRKTVIANLQEYFQTELDQELSVFKAINIVDFLTPEIGVPIYNKAVKDVSAMMYQKATDVESEFFEPETPLRTMD